jgi:hypothetical protein
LFKTEFFSGYNVDTVIRIFNSSGIQVAYGDDGWSSNGSSNYTSLTYNPSTTGKYTVSIGTYSNSAALPSANLYTISSNVPVLPTQKKIYQAYFTPTALGIYYLEVCDKGAYTNCKTDGTYTVGAAIPSPTPTQTPTSTKTPTPTRTLTPSVTPSTSEPPLPPPGGVLVMTLDTDPYVEPRGTDTSNRLRRIPTSTSNNRIENFNYIRSEDGSGWTADFVYDKRGDYWAVARFDGLRKNNVNISATNGKQICYDSVTDCLYYTTYGRLGGGLARFNIATNTETILIQDSIMSGNQAGLCVGQNSSTLYLCLDRGILKILITGNTATVTNNGGFWCGGGYGSFDGQHAQASPVSVRATFRWLTDIAWHPTKQRLYVTDQNTGNIRSIDINGNTSTLCGPKPQDTAFGFANGPSTQAKFNAPQSIEIGPDNNLYVIDQNTAIYTRTLRVINPDTGIVTAYHKPGSGGGSNSSDSFLLYADTTSTGFSTVPLSNGYSITGISGSVLTPNPSYQTFQTGDNKIRVQSINYVKNRASGDITKIYMYPLRGNLRIKAMDLSALTALTSFELPATTLSTGFNVLTLDFSFNTKLENVRLYDCWYLSEIRFKKPSETASSLSSLSYVLITRCDLSQQALVQLLNEIPSRAGKAVGTLNIKDNPGATWLTTAEKNIAVAKNWTLITA